jgi:hypothetical protein
MSTTRSLLIALVGACSLLLSYSGAWAWQANINSGWASSVVVDAAGNVVAAGSTNDGTGSAFTVIKYNGVTGREIWRRVFSGTDPDRFDSANAVTLDGAGNVVAAGVTNSGCVVGWDCELVFGDFTVIKLSGVDGTELWRQVIGSASNSYGSATYGSANAVAVDRAGNVVAAGASSSSLGDFTVVKYNGATGAELWRRVLTGSVPIGDCGDSARAVTVDGEGNVVASGFICNAPPFESIPTVIKFNGVTGQELWRKAIAGVSVVAIDSQGHVVAAGSIPDRATFTSAFSTIKFNGATGQELWRQVISGTANAAGSSNFASAVASDAQGNVVAAGVTTNNGTGRDFTVIKFNGATGAELRRQGINDADNANIFPWSAARALAIDFQGNVVAAGSTTNNGTGSAFTAIKFNGVTGTELWRQVIEGTGTGNAAASANAVAVDARGNVVAAGSTGNDFTVVKFNGRPAAADFDGDGITDIGVYRNGTWFVLRSSDGGVRATEWGGLPQDKPVPGDYDGDGKVDHAVYRDGTWFVIRSSDGGVRATDWGGLPQDIPLPADYDGDGKTDVAVYRDGIWFIIRSSDGAQISVGWGGVVADVPVPADYDGDGKADIAVYRDGTWFILRTSDGGVRATGWGGVVADIPVPADYDGDGNADIAVYRDGIWFIIRSSDGAQVSVGWGGLPQDVPVPADFDGDGKADVAVYRDGIWFILRSSDGAMTSTGWGGAAGDIPLNQLLLVFRSLNLLP